MDNCKIWPAAKDKDGYGLVRIGGKQYRAHRVALEKKLGRKLKIGECALHICHITSCVNENHLKVGTVQQNNQEANDRKQTLSKTILGIDRKLYNSLD